MLNRRGFLKTTLLVGAVPALTRARPALANNDELWLVVDGSCGDTRRFAACCGVTARGATDPSAVLHELARDSVQYCFGLSRDSDYFLIEQMAVALGYRRGYHGVHDYRAGRLHHRLTAAQDMLQELAQAFSAAGADWAVQLASAVPALSRNTARSAQLEVQSDSPRPLDSGGYLVSWCLKRA